MQLSVAEDTKRRMLNKYMEPKQGLQVRPLSKVQNEQPNSLWQMYVTERILAITRKVMDIFYYKDLGRFF